MTTKTCHKLIDLGIKNLVKNQIANELPTKHESLTTQIPAHKTEVELVTKKELVSRLKMSSSSINRRMNEGMPCIKRGSKVYFDFSKVIKWLEGGREK